MRSNINARSNAEQVEAFTFMSLLKACTKLNDLQSGMQIHSEILENNMITSDGFVGNALIDMYAQCGSVEMAKKVFDNLVSRDVVSWTALIAGYVDNGFGEEALELYHEMMFDGIPPNDVTCLSVIKACSNLASLHHVKCVHDNIVEHRLDFSSSVESTQVDMYVKCGSLEDALATFDALAVKDVVSWNSIIGGCADHGSLTFAIFTL